MLVTNRHATRQPYPAELRARLSHARALESQQILRPWQRLNPQPTPLISLPGLARHAGVAQLALKDESVRSPLGSFKVLGAPLALVRHILREHPDFEASAILGGRYAAALSDLTVISATDGNHGRALAAAAQDAGCACVIVLHAEVSAEREQAIADCGARIIRITGDYDASVAHAAELARRHHWQVISDTSYPGYDIIPGDVMQGYAIIACEIMAQTPSGSPLPAGYSHVFLQGGVGGFAAAIVAEFWERFGANRPTFIVVEPEQADCLQQSALQDRPARATGAVDSVMAGLACGETSPLAWQFLRTAVDHFLTIPDASAVIAMQDLAKGSTQEPPIVAGESGAAGLGALQILCAEPSLARRVGLSPESRVLIINTEGATAPAVYQRLVRESVTSVLARQAVWAPHAIDDES